MGVSAHELRQIEARHSASTGYEFDNLSADHTIAASFAADPAAALTVTSPNGGESLAGTTLPRSRRSRAISPPEGAR